MLIKHFWPVVLLSTLSACHTPSFLESALPNSSPYQLSGYARFPENLRIQNATIAQRATISLIYPPGHARQHQSITVGTTNEQGQFNLNPSLNFSPNTDTVYLLEAVKRLNGPQSDLLSLSTYVHWNGSTWESITGQTVVLNSTTTALVLIDQQETSLQPAELINTVTYAPPNTSPSAVGSVTQETIEQVQNLTHFLRQLPRLT